MYAPPRAGYLVRISKTYQPARSAERWHVALIIRGAAVRASTQFSAAAAVGWAERVSRWWP